MLAHHLAEGINYGERAAAMAGRLGDAQITSHALTNIGMAKWFLGDPAGQPTLDEALRVALAAGATEDACRAYVNMVWTLLDWFRLDEAEQYLTASIKFAEDAEFLGFLSYMQAELARLALSRAEWDEARRLAELGLDGRPTRCAALTLLGRLGCGAASPRPRPR